MGLNVTTNPLSRQNGTTLEAWHMDQKPFLLMDHGYNTERNTVSCLTASSTPFGGCYQARADRPINISPTRAGKLTIKHSVQCREFPSSRGVVYKFKNVLSIERGTLTKYHPDIDCDEKTSRSNSGIHGSALL